MTAAPLPFLPDAESKRDLTRLAWLFARDLSTCDRGELEQRWDERMRAALSRAGISFEERGEHELKGVPERWALYAASG